MQLEEWSWVSVNFSIPGSECLRQSIAEELSHTLIESSESDRYLRTRGRIRLSSSRIVVEGTPKRTCPNEFAAGGYASFHILFTQSRTEGNDFVTLPDQRVVTLTEQRPLYFAEQQALYYHFVEMWPDFLSNLAEEEVAIAEDASSRYNARLEIVISVAIVITELAYVSELPPLEATCRAERTLRRREPAFLSVAD
jgi:hypothetical protein